MLVDQRLHLGAACHDRHDRLAEPEAQILHQLRIERIRESDMQTTTIKCDGKGPIQPCHA